MEEIIVRHIQTGADETFHPFITKLAYQKNEYTFRLLVLRVH